MDSTNTAHRSGGWAAGSDLAVGESMLGPAARLLTFEGEVDIASAEPFRTRLSDAAKVATGWLVVDLSAVSFLDSVALAALVRARRQIGDRGRLVIVIAPESFPALVFDAAGLTHHFEIVETASAARALVTAPR
jgi:anti-sigma B factor antagonist